MKRHIPNTLTCLNLIIGALGCIAIIKGDLWNAIYFVIAAAIFDFFDGFAARLLHVKSDIGKELDSLADMVSFGLLPAVYMYGMINATKITPAALAYLGILIAAFSALRLAKFNVDTRQSDKFIGLPTPANAIMITSINFLPYQLEAWQLFIITGLSCFLLVSPITMLALKFKSFSIGPNILRYALIIGTVIIVAFFGLPGLVFVIPAYIILSIIGQLAFKNLM